MQAPAQARMFFGRKTPIDLRYLSDASLLKKPFDNFHEDRSIKEVLVYAFGPEALELYKVPQFQGQNADRVYVRDLETDTNSVWGYEVKVLRVVQVNNSLRFAMEKWNEEVLRDRRRRVHPDLTTLPRSLFIYLSDKPEPEYWKIDDSRRPEFNAVCHNIRNPSRGQQGLDCMPHEHFDKVRKYLLDPYHRLQGYVIVSGHGSEHHFSDDGDWLEIQVTKISEDVDAVQRGYNLLREEVRKVDPAFVGSSDNFKPCSRGRGRPRLLDWITGLWWNKLTPEVQAELLEKDDYREFSNYVRERNDISFHTGDLWVDFYTPRPPPPITPSNFAKDCMIWTAAGCACGCVVGACSGSVCPGCSPNTGLTEVCRFAGLYGATGAYFVCLARCVIDPCNRCCDNNRHTRHRTYRLAAVSINEPRDRIQRLKP